MVSIVKIRLDGIKCPAGYSTQDFKQAVREAWVKTAESRGNENREFQTVRVLKKSLDARKKPSLFYVFTVLVSWDEPEEPFLPESLLRIDRESRVDENFLVDQPGDSARTSVRPVIAGCGPAGLFAALTLARNGYRPLLIERGKAVEDRIKDIHAFWEKGILLPESNVQFGEGGAGTFSDGKLTTGIKDPSCRAVLETFVDAGAPEEILTMAKPHIGTDLLRNIIKTIRERIESLGGTVLFETKLTGIHIVDGRIQSIEVTRAEDPHPDLIRTDTLILAIGHSARDTIRMLSAKGVEMQAKPFSMGVRIEHFQKAVNLSQYGRQPEEIENILPAAEYKLACHLPNGRDVYTFCMCPGGQVIASASGVEQVVTNGMSMHARGLENANSAVLVNVDPSDYDSDSPLAGIDFQEKWEREAFLAGGASYKAPAQYVGDFLKKTPDAIPKRVIPTYTPGVAWTDLASCLPSFVTQSLRMALPLFDQKLAGFASTGAVMTAIESRSSSPVRILRNSAGMARIEGLYPCGEGAGYAGGIMSASVDGIACARSCMKGMGGGSIIV